VNALKRARDVLKWEWAGDRQKALQATKGVGTEGGKGALITSDPARRTGRPDGRSLILCIGVEYSSMKPTSPSLAPSFDTDSYLALDEIALSRVYRESEEIDADRTAVMLDIADGQYNRPYRVVAFNTGEGWARDVTEEIAREMIDMAVRSGHSLTRSARSFIESVTDEDIPQSALEDH
jgi:hypothetical protein